MWFKPMIEIFLNEWGITIRDDCGKFRPLNDVVAEFSELYDLQDHMGQVALLASAIMAQQSDENDSMVASPDGLYDALIQVCVEKQKENHPNDQ